MSGPNLSARLMDVRTDQPRRKLHEHFRDRAENDANSVAGLLQSAYAEGVRDGFQQGVEFCDRRDAPDA